MVVESVTSVASGYGFPRVWGTIGMSLFNPAKYNIAHSSLRAKNKKEIFIGGMGEQKKRLRRGGAVLQFIYIGI